MINHRGEVLVARFIDPDPDSPRQLGLFD